MRREPSNCLAELPSSADSVQYAPMPPWFANSATGVAAVDRRIDCCVRGLPHRPTHDRSHPSTRLCRTTATTIGVPFGYRSKWGPRHTDPRQRPDRAHRLVRRRGSLVPRRRRLEPSGGLGYPPAADCPLAISTVVMFIGRSENPLTTTQPLLVDAAGCVVLDRLVRLGSPPSPSALSRRFSFLLVWRLEMIRSRAKRLRAKPRRLLSLRSAAISFGTNQAVTLWLALARSASGTWSIRTSS
jgi:hypothetical protein